MKRFKMVTDFEPQGDQPQAISKLVQGIKEGRGHQVLLGVTGSGKTFTIAKVIEEVQRPVLVMAPNKTLAAQLYGEFKNLFPENAIEYFVSYYDYYQPEAYLPVTDTYIEKDSSINDIIDKMRHGATHSLFERNDVIIVASVSCIYGLGSPEAYSEMLIRLEEGVESDREEILRKLVAIQYERNDVDFHRGTFRVRGDRIEIFPVYEDERAYRIEFFGDLIEAIWMIDPLRGKKIEEMKRIAIYPGSHYVTSQENLRRAIADIHEELGICLRKLKEENKFLEYQRLEQRTLFDIEMMEEMGYCQGIENYSRHLTRRKEGEPPPTLLEYLPQDALIILDESHVTVPQLVGMYRGDRARKTTLVKYGFRLPSALDNRPLRFEEYDKFPQQRIYISATPALFELEKAQGQVVEQIIRPTGLIDPEIIIRPVSHQIDDLLSEIWKRVKKDERVLVSALTKRMAENLTTYYQELGVRVRYLHSDVQTLERVAIIRDLRLGKFDVLVGVNLLREGLDLPEVSLVAILDADKEGFLRSERSLIQTGGRAARNVGGQVIMYADHITGAMEACLRETDRRRHIQRQHNIDHGITPETVRARIHTALDSTYKSDYDDAALVAAEETLSYGSMEDVHSEIKRLTGEMKERAKNLEFEKAAVLRDQIAALRQWMLR